MKKMILILGVTLSALFTFAMIMPVFSIISSCGTVWHMNSDQIPDHVTNDQLFDYIMSVDDLLCD